jgi:hypothetical protein
MDVGCAQERKQVEEEKTQTPPNGEREQGLCKRNPLLPPTSCN